MKTFIVVVHLADKHFMFIIVGLKSCIDAPKWLWAFLIRSMLIKEGSPTHAKHTLGQRNAWSVFCCVACFLYSIVLHC